MPNNEGFIYVLTNPSFPEYVKIGYADNVKVRVDQLNRSECTPFAFRVYATLHVTSRLADKQIHNIIDSFKPELRAKESVNGKMRVREFFAMTAKEAVDLLAMIGSIYGETPCIYEKSTEEEHEENVASKNAIETERRSPFSFYKCGIRQGEKIVYINDSNVVCTVANEREIIYQGKKTSVSALAQKLLNRKSVQGTLHFTYNGEVLSALRKRLEDEGKYQDGANSDNNVVSADEPVANAENGCLLYFAMTKFKATCLWKNDKFTLLKGSAISPTFTGSCPNSVKDLRKQHANCISKDFITTVDITFDSSSTAGAFVYGGSINGKIIWKNADGVLLKDLLSNK